MPGSARRRSEHKLLALSLRKLKPGMHGDGGGLWLQVTPNGRSWIFRYTFHDRAREMGLGSLKTVGLSEARDAAKECRKLLAGTPTIPPVDPIEHRRALHQASRIDAAKTMSFRQCAEAYIATHSAGWRNPKHAVQWPSTLASYVYPVFGDLPVDAVDTGLVMKALVPIWTTKPETASRVRGRIEAVLDWEDGRVPQRREPGALARSPGKSADEQGERGQGGAPRARSGRAPRRSLI
jgi:hypothetical protein